MTPAWGPAGLVVVTDRRQAAEAGHDLVDVVAAAVAAGARTVLLREKDLPATERRALARTLARVSAAGAAALVVAGDRGLASAVGAAAVHLASTDPWPSPGRDRPVVGRSCHTIDELREARRHGAAYATLSPVFATASKPRYGPALGPTGIATARAAVPDSPLVALGGVVPGVAAQCLTSGADAVAVMGAIMRAADPGAVTRELVAELAGARAAGGPAEPGPGWVPGPAPAVPHEPIVRLTAGGTDR
jgi:thiamine-phosphate pyrophosphorylase